MTNFNESSHEVVKEFLKHGKLSFSENNYTAEIVLPFFKEDLGYHCLFDDQNLDGSRPDVQCFLTADDKKTNRGCVVVIESKLPNDFNGLTLVGVIEKFLGDKIIPYSIASGKSLGFIILHCFTRYIIISINDELLADIHKFKVNALPKSTLINAIVSYSSEFNLELRNSKERQKEIQRLQSFLKAHVASGEIAQKSFVGHYKISSQTDLKKFCTDLSGCILDTSENDGIYTIIKNHFYTEISKRTSQIKFSYRLFLSTRYPDESDSVAIDKKDSENEKELFVLCSIYNLISKLFIQKFVEDCFSGDEGIISSKDCFISNYPVDSTDHFHTTSSGLLKVAGNTTDAYKQILEGNEYFNWIVSPKCLNNLQYEAMIKIFKNLDLSSYIDELGNEFDILGTFFENFSERFNKEVRRVFGQYYTPKEVVSFIWDRVLNVVKSESLDLDSIKLLDPACGSGTFIVEGMKKLSHSSSEDIANKIVAFDISPMAATIAEVNIYIQALKQTSRKNLRSLKKVNVYNTDSLNIAESLYWQKRLDEEDDEARLRVIEEHRKVSSKYKKKKEYTLIVTNPPYNGSSSRSLDSFAGKFTLLDFLNQNKHKDDRIRDDYVWFMGAIDHYINDNGVVGLITSDSYLFRKTYKSLRKYLYDNYRIYEVYQLGENIFDDVKVATSIIILSKLKDTDALLEKDYSFDFYDLTKMNFNSNRLHDERFKFLRGEIHLEPEEVKPDQDSGFSFVHSAKSIDYKNCVKLFDSKSETTLLTKKYSGIVSGYKEFFTCPDKNKLSKRIESFFEISARAQQVWKGRPRPNVTSAEIKSVGQEIINGARYEKLIKDIEYFILEQDIEPTRMKQNAVPYLCFLISSILLRGLTFEEEKIRQTCTIKKTNKWSLESSQLEYIYFEENFVIPRVTKNGSDISGGPITCWRDNHEIRNKYVLVSQSEEKGFSLILKCYPGLINPYVLKAISGGGGEAHFFSADELEVPALFRNFQITSQSLALYMQAVINSSWPALNTSYVISNGVIVPLPNPKNINLINRVIGQAKTLNSYGLIISLKENNLSSSSDRFLPYLEASVLDDLNLKSLSRKELEKINLADLKIQIGALEKRLDANVSQIFKINNEINSFEQGLHAKTLPFEAKNKIQKVVENRLAITALILAKLGNDKDLYRTKFQKVFFVIDTMIKEDLKTKYVREAAGPLDYDLMYNKKNSVEILAEKQGLVKISRNADKVKYIPISSNSELTQKGIQLLGNSRNEVDAFLRFVKSMSVTQTELLATLYAIWNDLLISRSEVNDQILERELLEGWHAKKTVKFKGRITDIRRMIKSMKDNKIIPKGVKNPTK